MEEQQYQQSNRERFNDDPVVLMSLPQLEKISEFWKRYDRLADINDKKMTSNLSENLDVLLIFAALFSAINTAFISLTMPALSSDPLAETNTLLRLLVMRMDNNTLVSAELSPAFSPSSNSVTVSCLLYASLSCSLLAAVGAMMAKEWLQSFDQTGQTGPLEEQGRLRQRKFNGVQGWHLETTIQFLPNLLLLSVILFFVGVCLFLLPVNKAVAGVVIAFSGGGALLCGATIVAGATSPLCPYQSAASRALRRTGILFSLRWWRRLLQTVVDVAVARPLQLILTVFDVGKHSSRNVSTNLELVPSTPSATTLHEAGTSDEVVTAQAACWLLGTTSNRGDQIAAAQLISTLNNTACALAFEDSGTWRRLVSLTHEAFDIWHSQPSERNQEVAELFGLTSCHVLLQFSNDVVKRNDLIDLLLYRSRSLGGAFLRALEFALTKYQCRRSEDEEYILHVAILATILSNGSVIPKYQWLKLSRVFSVVGTPHLADVLPGLWAIYVCNIDPDRSLFNRSYAFEDLMEVGNNKSALARKLLDAVGSGSRVLPLVQGNLQSELNAIRGYSYCLRRALELSSPRSSSGQRDKAAHSVADLMLSFIDPLASSDSGKSDLELARLSIKTVSALHGLIKRNLCANEISVSQDFQSEQFLNGHLIDAVVDMMLEGFKSLTSPELLPRTQRVRVRVRVERVLWWLREERRVLRLEQQGKPEGRERELDEGERGLEELGREQALALALARERARALELERELERVQGRVQARAQVLARARARERGTRERELVLEGAQAQLALMRAREQAQVLAREHALVQVLVRALERALRLLMESCLVRILLWVWKRTPVTQLDHSASFKIFTSSCRLWAPLETTVDLIKNGIKLDNSSDLLTTFDDNNQDKLLTSSDLKMIVEFVEYLQKDQEKSAFIARNADVGINRLYVHLDRREDWNYELYNLREPRTLCSRSINTDNGMV